MNERLALVAALFVASLAASASAEVDVLRSSAFLTNGVRGMGTVDTVGRSLEKISVFAYHITEDGDVVPPSPWVPGALDQLMSAPGGHLVLVTVNNRVIGEDGNLSPEHGGETVKAILSDPAKRAEHIRQLAALASSAHGIELNYERFTFDMKDLFTDFVRDLRAAMPAGKKLSLVLQPKEDGRSGSNGYAVDWRAVEPHADYMRIMAYYYAYSTSEHGPVVSMETLRRLADFALRDPDERIPRHKVSVILSAWGWDWPLPVGTPGTLVQFHQAMETARAHGVTPVRDPDELTLDFRYTSASGIDREVWIDDATSLGARIDLLRDHDMPRVDFWHLNTGEPALWERIASETAATPRKGLDFDSDRLSDFAVFRPSNGGWFIDATRSGGTDLAVTYGKDGDLPVPGDYDGDGVLDVAVFRPRGSGWFVDTTFEGGTDRRAFFGPAGSIPVPADYDGDGSTDFAVFDPSTATWLVDPDHDGASDLEVRYGGREGDIPMPGDYDGDGRADFALFRPSWGAWYVDTNRNGGTDLVVPYGRSGDLPVASDYDGDGSTDFAVFRTSWGGWYVDTDRNGGTDIQVGFGKTDDVPVPANHDGDGVMDVAIFRPADARWLADTNLRGDPDHAVRFGAPGDVPLRENGWILDAMGLTGPVSPATSTSSSTNPDRQKSG